MSLGPGSVDLKQASAEGDKDDSKGKPSPNGGEDDKGQLEIQWDGDDYDEEGDYYGSDEEEIPEGEVGEEFAKARREALRLKREKRLAEEEGSDDEDVMEEKDLWNFPVDKDNWEEGDIGEEWADAWAGDEKTGFDPELVEDWEDVKKLWKEGKGPPARPYYVPYRKHYPLIPEDHPDIQTPQDVVQELERYEEFLVWASYIFKDGSTYEGTVWDDLAHGRGVYITALDLCRYEGEWFQNAMEGHGVLEVNVPVIEPPPDSEAAKKWRAQGKILETDFMSDVDREWVKMEIEDAMENPEEAIDPNPFEDDELWVKHFGKKPEKGHYKYSGQWKHSRMHGCGLYEVNGRQLYGQFYFGELLPYKGVCDEKQVAIHAGLAEIAAGKARMFINKPDGMVREFKGPYSDPSHPYMYEEEDLWMAPGFINAFYDVPDVWKRYVEEVDEEQQLWLNSFIKSPFRIPMPPELEYQWAQNDEFIVLSNKDSNPMYQYPENLDPAVEGDILLHVPTGNLINWAEDPDGNLRFFLQPFQEDGVIRPETVIPLPLGFEEFMGEVDEKGNLIDESRRGLSLEERKKLEKEDKKKEAKEKFRAKIEEIRQKGNEKFKKKERVLYIKKLERKAEKILQQQRLKAKLEAAAEEDAEVAAEDNDGNADSADGNNQGLIKESPEEREGEEEKDGEEEDDDDNDNDDDDDDGTENDEDDKDDKKPRSFGDVALVQREDRATCNHKEAKGSTGPIFPTIFASLSLVSQVAFKQALESSISNVGKVWSSKFFSGLDSVPVQHKVLHMFTLEGNKTIPGMDVERGPNPFVEVTKAKKVVICKTPNITVKLHHFSGGNFVTARARHQCMPASGSLLSAFKPRSSSQASWRVTKSRRNKKSQSRSWIQPSNSSLWVLPDMEVLSMALPVQIL